MCWHSDFDQENCQQNHIQNSWLAGIWLQDATIFLNNMGTGANVWAKNQPLWRNKSMVSGKKGGLKTVSFLTEHWTGCPGRLWSLILWRYSRPTWTRSYAACCRWPCFGRGVELDDPQRSLPTPTILWFCDSVICDSVILWFKAGKNHKVTEYVRQEGISGVPLVQPPARSRVTLSRLLRTVSIWDLSIF